MGHATLGALILEKITLIERRCQPANLDFLPTQKRRHLFDASIIHIGDVDPADRPDLRLVNLTPSHHRDGLAQVLGDLVCDYCNVQASHSSPVNNTASAGPPCDPPLNLRDRAPLLSTAACLHPSRKREPELRSAALLAHNPGFSPHRLHKAPY